MIQDIRQCIIILKNFERDVEELFKKYSELTNTNSSNQETILQLQNKITELEAKLKEKNNGEGNDGENK